MLVVLLTTLIIFYVCFVSWSKRLSILWKERTLYLLQILNVTHIAILDFRSLAGVLFLVPRLIRLLEANHHMLVVETLLTGLYTELFRTNHPKTTRQLLNSLTNLVIDGQLEEQWKSVVFEYLTDFLANELEDFLWSPLGDVVKYAFNLLVEMQRLVNARWRDDGKERL
jgi:hypothetical protein